MSESESARERESESERARELEGERESARKRESEREKAATFSDSVRRPTNKACTHTLKIKSEVHNT